MPRRASIPSGSGVTKNERLLSNFSPTRRSVKANKTNLTPSLPEANDACTGASSRRTCSCKRCTRAGETQPACAPESASAVDSNDPSPKRTGRVNGLAAISGGTGGASGRGRRVGFFFLRFRVELTPESESGSLGDEEEISSLSSTFVLVRRAKTLSPYLLVSRLRVALKPATLLGMNGFSSTLLDRKCRWLFGRVSSLRTRPKLHAQGTSSSSKVSPFPVYLSVCYLLNHACLAAAFVDSSWSDGPTLRCRSSTRIRICWRAALIEPRDSEMYRFHRDWANTLPKAAAVIAHVDYSSAHLI